MDYHLYWVSMSWNWNLQSRLRISISLVSPQSFMRFRLMSYYSVAAYAILLPMRETYKKAILERRSKKLGIPGPPKPPVKGWAYVKLLLTITLIRPLHMLFREPIVLFFSLYNSFTFSVLFGFFAAYPYTFTTVYEFNTWQYGLAFLGIFIGVLFAVPTGIITDRLIYYKKYKEALKQGKTVLPPEERLYAAMLGSLGIPIGWVFTAWPLHLNIR